MGKTSIRMGVDIGGTFTDVVLEVGDAQYSTKVLTTYLAPEDAIIDGVKQVCGKAKIEPSEIGQIIHGTTLATNALIERRGAKTALITTQGFRDVIEMRTESRFEQYDLNLTLPEPFCRGSSATRSKSASAPRARCSFRWTVPRSRRWSTRSRLLGTKALPSVSFTPT